ncbi:MAG TPA: CHAT domain-containing tetratricopeptide repeat protein [Chryseosolibacter sp.]|nr:CHAT domain-containing tetratricopeptide repeat protein [Chryseosolibacter sp.]
MRLSPNSALTLILIFISFNAFAQDDDELSNLIGKGLSNLGSKKKAKLDSIDFQFAISVNENAGLINISQKGEKLTRGLYELKAQSEKTPQEIARDTVDYATGLYEYRMYQLAETAFQDAKNYIESENLTTDISYVRLISNMTLLYMAQGKVNEAATYLEMALKTSSTVGTKSPAYIANLNSQAKLAQMNGHYNEAEKDFDEVLRMVKDVFSQNSLQYAIVLNNKALLYQNVGRYDDAITLMNEAITTAEAAFKKAMKRSKNSFDGRRFQSNLAFMLQMAGKYPEAEAVFLEMKKSYERNIASNNPEYAALLNQLAVLYMQTKKYDQVEALLKKAQEIFKKKQSEESPGYARATADLGNFYRLTAKYVEAEPLLIQALNIREQVLGNNHPDYIRTKEDLAILYWKTERFDKAFEHYKPVMDKTIDFINKYFPPMSEAEKTKFWDITAPRFQRFYNFALAAAPNNPAIVADIYDYQTATKGLLLNSTNKIKQSILKSGDKSLIDEYLLWLDKKETLARFYSLSKEELTEQKIDLSALEAEANTLERSLSSRSAAFSSGYSTHVVSFQKIRDLLTEKEAVVEIIRVQTFDNDFTADSRYIVLVLTKAMKTPKMIVLDNGAQLETRYAKFYRNAIQQKLEDGYSYDQYWARFDSELAGKKTIFVSPDGAFNQINLNTLKKPAGDYVLKNYDLTIVGNSKDLIELKAKKGVVAKKDGVLLGFPDYGGNRIAALPGTKVEIETVSKILKGAGYKLSQYAALEASEKNVKALKSPSLMHIATHGYFLKDSESQKGAFGISAENAANNPLLRSGLMLANASKTIDGAASDIESNDNGILTAYEAMSLNLEGTNLIVLSACETGLGDVKNGEGVYGLQRAFLVAGADAMIMSLWKVDDAATQQLMTNFYTNWIKLGNKQTAFKQAQLQLMAKYKEPYYWGAFVMMGM